MIWNVAWFQRIAPRFGADGSGVPMTRTSAAGALTNPDVPAAW